MHRWFQHDPRARSLIDEGRRIRRSNRELLRDLPALYRMPLPAMVDALQNGDPLPGGSDRAGRRPPGALTATRARPLTGGPGAVYAAAPCSRSRAWWTWLGAPGASSGRRCGARWRSACRHPSPMKRPAPRCSMVAASVSLLALVPFADHSAVSRPIEADVQRPKHGENVLVLDPELIAYIGQLDLPPGLRGTLLVRHDGGAVNPRVGDEPAVRTGRELRLRKV